MEWIEWLGTLMMLILLQAVLGIDNLLYIAMESGRVEERMRRKVQIMGVGGAIVLRIALLFLLLKVVSLFQTDFKHFRWGEWVEFSLSGHAIIVLVGGVFIIYTAVKEVWHLLSPEEAQDGNKRTRSARSATVSIILMNAVFSFDSVLTAMALTEWVSVMAIAIVVSGVLMIALAERVSQFLKKNRVYEVLGLFILLIVGVMLLSEGGHLAHLKFFGEPVEPMSQTTFYFVIAVLIAIDVVQGRYQKKLAERR
jgi:predicted tellurium resistance membrane protein TerC